MSLIHDALKKAQAPSGGEGKVEFPQFVQDADEAKGKKSTRMIVLAVILVGALIYVAYDKFFAGKKGVAPIKPIAATATSNPDEKQTKQMEASRLKEEAVKSFYQGNLEDAWIRLSTAGQLDPLDAEIWNNMGLVSKRRGDVAKARDFFNKALQIKPDYPECLNNLAVLDIDNGDLDKAMEKLGKAVILKPDYADATFHMAVVEDQRGNTRLAAGYYKKFIELKTDAPPKLLEDVRRRVADIETE